MEKKLRWARSNIMQPQEGDDDCWAAVIEAALAFFNQQINNRPLRSVVHQFRSLGGRIGSHGAKDFGEALKAFGIFSRGKKNPSGFAQLPQV